MARSRGHLRGAPPNGRPSLLLGKRVIVDVTYERATRSGDRRRQFYGVITDVSRHNVSARLTCGAMLDLPPDPDLYAAAPAGPCLLASTGETVAAADLVIAFTTAGPYGAGSLRAVPD